MQRKPVRCFPRCFALSLVLLAITVSLVVPERAAGQSTPDPGLVMFAIDMKAVDSRFLPGAEKGLLDLVNRLRNQRGLRSLSMNSSLCTAARSHSREMALGGFIGHGSPSTGSFLTRLSAVVGPGTFVGENVASGLTIEQVERAFEASPGHLQNLLEPRFRSVGIGIATGPTGLMVTEDFAD